ncbi:MAG: glycosyltransferase family 4 protein [Flavisolibacter sp.]|nr:glycosyltransferase family 4 protein [Flavisolibacter sp.]
MPGQRLRYEQYLPYFEEAGYEVVVSSFMTIPFQKMVYNKGKLLTKAFWTLYGYSRRFFDLFRIRNYDIVYVFLWVTPFGPPFFERITRILSKQMIYDIDDLIYSKQKSKANPIISSLKGRNKPVYLFRKADHVITSTLAIEEFARKLNSNVSNIPVSIDTIRYTPKDDYEVKEPKIVLGWTGSLSTSPYMHLLDDVLKNLYKENPFTLRILGDASFMIEGIDVDAMAWTEQIEVPTIKTFDIGLYPLPDEEWVHGKGGGKALQYMSLGIPTVASAIGYNFKIIEQGKTGILVKNDEEWINALRKLINDTLMRERIGKNGAVVVEAKYSINANKHRYIKILNQLSPIN